MKDKKFKKLKKAFIFQAQKEEGGNPEPLSMPYNSAPDNSMQEQTPREQTPKENIKSFAVKTPPYILGDLKRIFWITLVAVIVVLSAYFLQKNSQIFVDFGNFLYRIFHLS